MFYRELCDFAIETILKAGAIVREGYYKIQEQGIEYVLKGYADPVTEYDKKSEELIMDSILKKYPNSSIIAEESGGLSSDSSLRWIVDPLDGTVNFIHSIPFVALSIGVEVDGKVVAGVIYNPILDELYYASLGGGSFLNNRRIHVSKNGSPQYSLTVTGFPYRREGRIEELLKPLRIILKEHQGFRRLGSACMDLAYVARGSFEVFYEESLKPWDTAAGKIIVEEAGGRVTDYYGNEYTLFSTTILATNDLMHEYMVSILKDVIAPQETVGF